MGVLGAWGSELLLGIRVLGLEHRQPRQPRAQFKGPFLFRGDPPSALFGGSHGANWS